MGQRGRAEIIVPSSSSSHVGHRTSYSLSPPSPRPKRERAASHAVDPTAFADIDVNARSRWWRRLPLVSFRIADVEIPNRYLLAPMCNVTNLPYRLLAREQGASLVSTEMLSSVALAVGGERSLQMMEFLPDEHPIMVQISGTDAEVMRRAAEMIQDYGATLINLNCGCPVKKIIKGGSGSALLRNPRLLRRILRALRPRLRIPLTVKMRAGWDEQSINAVEIARLCEDEGVDAIMLHPRTRRQMYDGQANLDLIACVKHAVRIPVIGNGDVFTATDALDMLAATGCDAVMIGRGAIGNPWIFRQCVIEEVRRTHPSSNVLAALPSPHPSLDERLTMIRRHFDLLAAYTGEEIALRVFRRQLMAYLKGLPHSTTFRGHLPQLTSRHMFLERVEAYFRKIAQRDVGARDHAEARMNRFTEKVG